MRASFLVLVLIFVTAGCGADLGAIEQIGVSCPAHTHRLHPDSKTCDCDLGYSYNWADAGCAPDAGS